MGGSATGAGASSIWKSGFSWSSYWTKRKPTGLTLTLIAGGVKLDWLSDDRAETEIWGKNDNGTYIYVGIIAAGTKTFNDDYVYPYSLRSYKIRVKYGIYYSDYCDEVSIAMLGNEKVVNGNFAADATWIKSSKWTIHDGKAWYDDTANDQISQSIAGCFVSGKVYKISFDVSDLSAGVAVQYIVYDYDYRSIKSITENGINGTTRSIIYYCANNSAGIRIYGGTTSSGTWALDNVSIKEVLLPSVIKFYSVGVDKPYLSIALGVAAATAGEYLVIDNGSWNETLNLSTKLLNVRGIGDQETIIKKINTAGNGLQSLICGTDSTFYNITFSKDNNANPTNLNEMAIITTCSPVFTNSQIQADQDDSFFRIMLVQTGSVVTMTNCILDCNTDMAGGYDIPCVITVSDTSTFTFTGTKFKAQILANDTAVIDINTDHLWTPFGIGLWSFYMNDDSSLNLAVNIEHHSFTQSTDVEFDMWEQIVDTIHLVDSNAFNLTGIIKGVLFIDGHGCTVVYDNVTATWGSCKLAAGTGGVQHGISNTNDITIQDSYLVYDAPAHHNIEDYQSCNWHIINSTIMHMDSSGRNGNTWCQPITIHKGFEGEQGSIEIINSSIIEYCDTKDNGYLQVVSLEVPFTFNNVLIEVRNSDNVQAHFNLTVAKPIGFNIEGSMTDVTFKSNDESGFGINIFDSVQDPANNDPIDASDYLCVSGIVNETQQSDISDDMIRYNLLVSQCPL